MISITDKEYEELFSEFCIPDDKYFDFLNDAQELTEDYQYRHGLGVFRELGVNKKLGALRWKGIFQYREVLLEILSGRGVDLGGAASPISEDSIVVDLLKVDSLGRRVQYKDIRKIKGKLDYVFTSHCLEHIQDYIAILKFARNKLKPDGLMFIHLPSYSCHRWRPENHKSASYGGHVWAFYLEKYGKPKEKITNLAAIDTIARKFFDIIEAEYVGDDSIILICKPK